ncbi:hypothetical protein [Streptomyces sp. NPDC096311]|uniref:hypothetical protein n=1 Tax=Streptomyces sp. NPDC096311 TaxID=3366083 RepID=UPI0037FF3E8A
MAAFFGEVRDRGSGFVPCPQGQRELLPLGGPRCGAHPQRLLRGAHGRRRDLLDVQQAILSGIDEIDILAVGDLPPETDFDAVVALCQRGLQELSRLTFTVAGIRLWKGQASLRERASIN